MCERDASNEKEKNCFIACKWSYCDLGGEADGYRIAQPVRGEFEKNAGIVLMLRFELSCDGKRGKRLNIYKIRGNKRTRLRLHLRELGSERNIKNLRTRFA